MFAEVAFARNRHAQRPVSEHLDAQQFAARTPYVLLHYRAMHLGNLRKAQFARQNHDISPLREELRRLAVRHVALGRDMHLDAGVIGIEYHRKVGRDNGIDAFEFRPVHDLVHDGEFVVVDYRIDGQIGFHAVFAGYRHDVRQIVEREVHRRFRPHVELPHSEIYRVGTRIYRRPQRLVRADGSHYLYIAAFHSIAR